MIDSTIDTFEKNWYQSTYQLLSPQTCSQLMHYWSLMLMRNRKEILKKRFIKNGI